MRVIICLGAAVFLSLAACTAQTVLPTRAVVAVVPAVLTATPFSSATHQAVPTATLPPTSTPQPAVTPQPSPAPSPTPCTSPGHIETGVFTSQAGGEMAYRVYLPPCYEANGRTYPTLYMLPGNEQTDAIWDDLGLDETADTAIRNNEIPPLLIVMPHGGWIALNSSGGPGSYESVILDDLIPFIEATYCAWPSGNGRAIGGLSRGGYWALEIAFRHPELFVSVGGHSASLLDVAAGPDLNPQYTGLTQDLGNLRIYLDIGSSDGGIGNTHTWVLNQGGHDNAYWMAHLREYVDWYGSAWLPEMTTMPDCILK